jgi:DNA-3-methyladenine glycosylase I
MEWVGRGSQRDSDKTETGAIDNEMPPELSRCRWAQSDALMAQYHDEEWGVPQYDSRALWEMLMLEGFQAGLSWSVVLKKREAFRKAFKNFEPARIAKLTDADVEKLLTNADIIRSRAKIEATIAGAKAYLQMQRSGEDFSEFVWSLAGGKPLRNDGPEPTQTPLSVQFSKEFKKRGFKFVGPVIVYAWMQAVGIVDDHSPDCFKRKRR